MCRVQLWYVNNFSLWSEGQDFDREAQPLPVPPSSIVLQPSVMDHCNKRKTKEPLQIIKTVSVEQQFLWTDPRFSKTKKNLDSHTNSHLYWVKDSVLHYICFSRGLQAVTYFLPDCGVGIHGNRGLKAHCSARDNRREESCVSGWAFEKLSGCSMTVQKL